MMTLQEMPNEILLEITLYLDHPSLNAFARVSRHFYALSNRELYKAAAKDSPGRAIAWAAEKGNEVSARKLLQMCGLKILDDLICEGREPIVIAASNGHTNLVELFLPHCIQHETEEDGYLFKKTLTAAIPGDHVAVVKLLLEHKGNLKSNRQDKHAAVPLCKAVEMEHVSIVKLLLEHDYCNLDTFDLDGMTPIALAAITKESSANLEIAQLLVEAGASLSMVEVGTDFYIDQKLLLKAARSDNLPVMKLLLANNLDWQQVHWFEVLYEFSRLRRENHEMGSLLLSWIDVDRVLKLGSIQRYYLLRGAITNRLDDLLEKILDEWPVLKEDNHPNPTESRFCPLSLAICYGRPRAVKLLLEHGADPNSDGHHQPMKFALEKGKDTMARLLLDSGATFDPEECGGSLEYRQLMKLRMARVQRRRAN